MFDLPPDIPTQTQTIVVAQVSTSQTSVPKANYTIGVCHLVQNPPIPPTTAVNTLSPITSASTYLEHNENHKFNWKHWDQKVLQEPKHGNLEMSKIGARYHPDLNYTGKDEATFIVEVDEIKILVKYYFKFMSVVGGTDGYDSYQDENNCPNGIVWKIN